MPRKVSLWSVAALFVALAAAAQTVDEVIAKNIEAKGGLDKIKAVQTARFSGKMTMGPGMEAPMVMEWKRPNKMRLEFTLQGMTGVQAYDGATGWFVMPFTGKTEPEKMSEEDVKDAAEQADVFDGPLMDYQEKGHQVELVGKEDAEGTPAWKLKITKKNGDVTYLYLDAEAYLEIRAEGKAKRRGQEVEFEASFGDYKEVGGVLLAHSIEQRPKGAPAGSVITIEKVELNPDLPDARFAMPEAKKPEPAPGR